MSRSGTPQAPRRAQRLRQRLRRGLRRGASSGVVESEERSHTEQQRQRFSRRRWQRRWLTWKYVLSAVTVLAIVAGTAWLVLFSSHLALKSVRVEGTQYLSKDEVVKAAGLPMGTPLARLDLAQAQNVVEGLRAVKSVDVTRQWPTSVRITITERTAVAVVQSGHLIRGLDAEGVLFREYGKRPANLPMVQAQGEVGEEALAEAAKVAGALPASLNRQMKVLRVRTVDDIILDMRNGKQIVWGSAGRSDLKAQVLPVLLKQPGTVYDVSAPSLPTVR